MACNLPYEGKDDGDWVNHYIKDICPEFLERHGWERWYVNNQLNNDIFDYVHKGCDTMKSFRASSVITIRNHFKMGCIVYIYYVDTKKGWSDRCWINGREVTDSLKQYER